MESLDHKWFNKWWGSHWCTQNTKLGIRKPRENDIKLFNLFKDQAIYFDGYTESLNANNYSYNCKNARATFDAWFAICVSFTKEGKT